MAVLMAHLPNNVLFIFNQRKINVVMHCNYVTIYSAICANSKLSCIFVVVTDPTWRKVLLMKYVLTRMQLPFIIKVLLHKATYILPSS